MKMTSISLTSVLIGMLSSICFLIAQAQPETNVLKTLQARPQVEVSFNQRSISVNGALDIHVRVTNLTENNIFLESAEIYMPGEFWAARGDSHIQSIRNYTVYEREEQLDPGNESLVSFAIPYQVSSFFSPLINHRLLTFMPNDYEVRVAVKYKIPPQRITAIQERVKIHIDPPLSSLIWGGVCGSLLLALFLMTYRLLRRTTSKNLRQIAVETLILILAGTVCAIIAIILLYRFKELPLPINIAVNDFYGGIVIGLFTYKLGDWLFGQMVGPSEQEKQVKD
jgi:hypothetical protein